MEHSLISLLQPITTYLISSFSIELFNPKNRKMWVLEKFHSCSTIPSLQTRVVLYLTGSENSQFYNAKGHRRKIGLEGF